VSVYGHLQKSETTETCCGQGRARFANTSIDYVLSASNWKYIRLVVCSGSGYSVVISVKETNLSPLYSSVDHSQGNDNAAFGGDATVVREFCPYPLPLYYRISSVVHQVNLSTRLHITCTHRYWFKWSGTQGNAVPTNPIYDLMRSSYLKMSGISLPPTGGPAPT